MKASGQLHDPATFIANTNSWWTPEMFWPWD
jgi:hypothetical protein